MEQRFPLWGFPWRAESPTGTRWWVEGWGARAGCHAGSLPAGNTAEGGHCEAEAARGAAALGAAQWQVHHSGRWEYIPSPQPRVTPTGQLIPAPLHAGILGCHGSLTLFPCQSVRDPSGASIALFTAKLHHPSKSVQHVVLQALFYLLDRAVER